MLGQNFCVLSLKLFDTLLGSWTTRALASLRLSSSEQVV